MLKFANVFPVKTLDLVNHDDYINIRSVLSQIKKIASLKEFKINGASIMQNRNYDSQELDTLDDNINRRFKQNLINESQRSRLSARYFCNYDDDYYDNAWKESFDEIEDIERSIMYGHQNMFEAPFL